MSSRDAWLYSVVTLVLAWIFLKERLCAAAWTLREQAQTLLPQAEREAFEQVVATARAALDEHTFADEWTIGAAFTHDEAIDYALSDA